VKVAMPSSLLFLAGYEIPLKYSLLFLNFSVGSVYFDFSFLISIFLFIYFIQDLVRYLWR
jgi:hypothetical protein